MIQKKIILQPYPRGFHIITDVILSQIGPLPAQGILHLFLQHTSAGLSISENADPDVRVDLESFFNKIVPENEPYLRHTLEGADDMPAHVKSSIVGIHLSIPISSHRLALGTWQGIYLCEFRNHGGHRTIVASIY